MKHYLITISSLLLLPFAALGQGDLNPPGPPAPTMKTLDQLNAAVGALGTQIGQVDTKQIGIDAKLEKRTPISSLPFTIGNSGSYYLTTDMRAASGQNGITVNASHVTIDLNGFRLTGFGANAAIFSTGTGRSNVAIRNGTIDGWSKGIDMFGVTAMRVENVRVVSNTSGGIFVGPGSLVSNCLAVGNGSRGIGADNGSSVSKCIVKGNTGAFNRGIDVGKRSLVVDCVVTENTGADSVALDAGEGSSVVRCEVSLGSGTNANAIATANSCRVIDCVVFDNNGTSSDGIRTSAGSLISGCTIWGNGGNGLVASSSSVLQNNNVSSNSGAGIELSSDRNRLEGNHVLGNSGSGILVTGTNNLIIRNSAGSNQGGDYVISAGNAASGVVSAANVGSNTNPHVNFDLD